MIKKKETILFVLCFLFLINFISATDIGISKQNEPIELYQMCSNCTYVNLTSVTYPNKTILNIGHLMARFGEDYTYQFNNTQQYGEYKYNVCGDKDSIVKCEVITFEVTPSGFSIDSGQSLGLFGSLVLIILIGIIFLVIAIKSNGTPLKLSFYTLSVVMFIISILYTVIIVQQTLFGFESILVGIESFWFIIKMFLTVGILAFFIVVFLVMLKYWRIKRGFE